MSKSVRKCARVSNKTFKDYTRPKSDGVFRNCVRLPEYKNGYVTNTSLFETKNKVLQMRVPQYKFPQTLSISVFT